MLEELSVKKIVGMDEWELFGCESHRRIRLECVVSIANSKSSVEERSGGS